MGPQPILQERQEQEEPMGVVLSVEVGPRERGPAWKEATGSPTSVNSVIPPWNQRHQSGGLWLTGEGIHAECRGLQMFAP
ncbi:unnamed protein product, partial [Cylicostephanus goldi]